MKAALRAELVFYDRLWKAADDRVIRRILEPMHLLVAQSIEESSGVIGYKGTLKHHERVLAAVRFGDAEAARHAMTALLRDAAAICSSDSVDRNWRLNCGENKKHF